MPDPTSIRQRLGLMTEEEFAALAEIELPTKALDAQPRAPNHRVQQQ